MSDFWDEVIEDVGLVEGENCDIDIADVDLTPAVEACQKMPMHASEALSMRDLTDAARAANAINPVQDAGTRVQFVTNIGSILSYDDAPADKLEGTVVTVKTGTGNTTYLDDRLFVAWDDGKFRDIKAEHLRLVPHKAQPSKKATKAKKSASIHERLASGAVRVSFSAFSDLGGFFAMSSGGQSDELVHRATKDLWALKQDGDNFVIERLFDETGNPLKV